MILGSLSYGKPVHTPALTDLSLDLCKLVKDSFPRSIHPLTLWTRMTGLHRTDSSMALSFR